MSVPRVRRYPRRHYTRPYVAMPACFACHRVAWYQGLSTDIADKVELVCPDHVRRVIAPRPLPVSQGEPTQ